MDLTDIPPKHEIIYFILSSPWKFLQNWPYIRKQSESPQIEIKSSILSDHHGLKLVINNNRNSREITNSGKAHRSILNENWVMTEIKKEFKKAFITKWKWKFNTPTHTVLSEGAFQRQVPSTKCWHLKKLEKSHINSYYTLELSTKIKRNNTPSLPITI